MPAYDPDLATIHDLGFGDYARRSGPGVLSLLRRSGVRGGLVVELGCGSGITARLLTDAGYRVLGIDQSAAMIRLARAAAPAARFRRASFIRADLPACDAVLALGEVVNYRFDAANSAAALRRVVQRAHAALRPGGVLLFDAAAPGRGAAPLPAYRKGADWAVLMERSEDARRRTLVRHHTTFRKVGRLYRRGEEVHRLRLIDPATMLAELRVAGFQAEAMQAYGRMRLPQGVIAYLARKPV